MSVAVAHQAASASRRVALEEAAREAALRHTGLDVIHVVQSLDLDLEEAYRSGLDEEIRDAVSSVGADGVTWTVHLASAPHDDVVGTILGQLVRLNPDLLVIGARRRSPVGKAFLGSVTQSLILAADVPILVVKA